MLDFLLLTKFKPPAKAHRGVGVLATERDSVSTYSRNYKLHKRERLQRGPTQGGKTRLCMRRARPGRERPATRLRPRKDKG